MSTVRSLGVATRLAGLVGFDLVWRVPTVTPGDGTGAEVAVAAVSVVSNTSGVAGLELLSTVALLGYVAATLAPRAYPDKLGVPADQPGFRVLFGLATAASALVFRALDASLLALLVVMFVVMGASGTAFLAYLAWMRGWTLSPEDDRFVRLLDDVFPDSSLRADLERDFSRSGLPGVVGVTVGRAAAAIVIVLPAILSGMVAVLLLLLYPVPDLLVLGWVALVSVEYATGRELAPRQNAPDLETRLYDIVEETTRSIKGTILAMYLVVAAVSFGLLFGTTTSVAAGVDWSLVTPPGVAPRFAWGTVVLHRRLG